MSPNHIFLNFTVSVLRISNLWPNKDHHVYTKWRQFKDTSLILSLMPCALPILADFVLQLHGTTTLQKRIHLLLITVLLGNVHNLTSLTENIIALTCIIGMIYMTICFIQKRRLIKKLVAQLDHFTAFSDSSSLVETDRKANLYAKVFLFYGIAGNIVYMTMPYLNRDKCRYQREQNMVDLDIPCGLVTRCWFPFKFDYTPVFEIVFVHQFYTCTMVSVVILDLTMLLCGFLMHITNQLKHLRRFIVELKFPEEKLLEKLHFCVKYHTAIIT
jgi:hypothetical protein